jgi:hypothetical protein
MSNSKPPEMLPGDWDFFQREFPVAESQIYFNQTDACGIVPDVGVSTVPPACFNGS